MTEKRTARKPPWLVLAAIVAFGIGTLVMFVTARPQTNLTEGIAVSAADAKTVRIPIQGMVCTVCAASVKKALLSLEGVQGAEISLERREAQVRYVEGEVSPQELVAAIKQLGYKASAPVPEASQ